MFQVQAIHRRCSVSAVIISLAGLVTAFSAAAEGDSFAFVPVLTVDALDNASGGLRRGARLMYNLDLTASWTGDRGWDAFAYVLADGNGGFSGRYSGDLQTVSNIDALPAIRLFEAWAHYTSIDGRWQTKMGLINLNSTFDTQPICSVFMNSSNGIGPEYSQSGPSIFPVTGLGVTGEWRVTRATTVRAGLFDGTPGDPAHPKVFALVRLGREEGLHRVVELEHRFDDGFVKFGHWDYTVPATQIDGAGTGPRQGTYVQAGWNLVKEAPDASQGLQGWVRMGRADSRVFKLDRYVGLGLVYTGYLPGHDADQMGISVMSAHLGTPYRTFVAARQAAETTLELTYKANLNTHVTVQPDIQFIRHPGGEGWRKDAIVIGARLRIQ